MDKFTFGKYKGKSIDDIIMSHIGYVFWCMEHIPWFKLTEEQQSLYDMCSIALNNQTEHQMPFPNEWLMKYVKNPDIESPLMITPDGVWQIHTADKSMHPYFMNKSKHLEPSKPIVVNDSMVLDLLRQMTMELENADDDNVYDEWNAIWHDD